MDGYNRLKMPVIELLFFVVCLRCHNMYLVTRVVDVLVISGSLISY